MAKPFLEPKTANKVKFAYSDDPNTDKMMNELFDMEVVESVFGGRDDEDFDVNKYAERMREDDEKLSSPWKIGDGLPLPPPATKNSESDTKTDKSDVPSCQDESLPVKQS